MSKLSTPRGENDAAANKEELVRFDNAKASYYMDAPRLSLAYTLDPIATSHRLDWIGLFPSQCPPNSVPSPGPSPNTLQPLAFAWAGPKSKLKKRKRRKDLDRRQVDFPLSKAKNSVTTDGRYQFVYVSKSGCVYGRSREFSIQGDELWNLTDGEEDLSRLSPVACSNSSTLGSEISILSPPAEIDAISESPVLLSYPSDTDEGVVITGDDDDDNDNDGKVPQVDHGNDDWEMANITEKIATANDDGRSTPSSMSSIEILSMSPSKDSAVDEPVLTSPKPQRGLTTAVTAPILSVALPVKDTSWHEKESTGSNSKPPECKGNKEKSSKANSKKSERRNMRRTCNEQACLKGSHLSPMCQKTISQSIVEQLRFLDVEEDPIEVTKLVLQRELESNDLLTAGEGGKKKNRTKKRNLIIEIVDVSKVSKMVEGTDKSGVSDVKIDDSLMQANSGKCPTIPKTVVQSDGRAMREDANSKTHVAQKATTTPTDAEKETNIAKGHSKDYLMEEIAKNTTDKDPKTNALFQKKKKEGKKVNSGILGNDDKSLRGQTADDIANSDIGGCEMTETADNNDIVSNGVIVDTVTYCKNGKRSGNPKNDKISRRGLIKTTVETKPTLSAVIELDTAFAATTTNEKTSLEIAKVTNTTRADREVGGSDNGKGSPGIARANTSHGGKRKQKTKMAQIGDGKQESVIPDAKLSSPHPLESLPTPTRVDDSDEVISITVYSPPPLVQHVDDAPILDTKNAVENNSKKKKKLISKRERNEMVFHTKEREVKIVSKYNTNITENDMLVDTKKQEVAPPENDRTGKQSSHEASSETKDIISTSNIETQLSPEDVLISKNNALKSRKKKNKKSKHETKDGGKEIVTESGPTCIVSSSSTEIKNVKISGDADKDVLYDIVNNYIKHQQSQNNESKQDDTLPTSEDKHKTPMPKIDKKKKSKQVKNALKVSGKDNEKDVKDFEMGPILFVQRSPTPGSRVDGKNQIEDGCKHTGTRVPQSGNACKKGDNSLCNVTDEDKEAEVLRACIHPTKKNVVVIENKDCGATKRKRKLKKTKQENGVTAPLVKDGENDRSSPSNGKVSENEKCSSSEPLCKHRRVQLEEDSGECSDKGTPLPDKELIDLRRKYKIMKAQQARQAKMKAALKAKVKKERRAKAKADKSFVLSELFDDVACYHGDSKISQVDSRNEYTGKAKDSFQRDVGKMSDASRAPTDVLENEFPPLEIPHLVKDNLPLFSSPLAASSKNKKDDGETDKTNRDQRSLNIVPVEECHKTAYWALKHATAKSSCPNSDTAVIVDNESGTIISRLCGTQTLSSPPALMATDGSGRPQIPAYLLDIMDALPVNPDTPNPFHWRKAIARRNENVTAQPVVAMEARNGKVDTSDNGNRKDREEPQLNIGDRQKAESSSAITGKRSSKKEKRSAKKAFLEKKIVAAQIDTKVEGQMEKIPDPYQPGYDVTSDQPISYAYVLKTSCADGADHIKSRTCVTGKSGLIESTDTKTAGVVGVSMDEEVVNVPVKPLKKPKRKVTACRRTVSRRTNYVKAMPAIETQCCLLDKMDGKRNPGRAKMRAARILKMLKLKEKKFRQTRMKSRLQKEIRNEELYRLEPGVSNSGVYPEQCLTPISNNRIVQQYVEDYADITWPLSTTLVDPCVVSMSAAVGTSPKSSFETNGNNVMISWAPLDATNGLGGELTAMNVEVEDGGIDRLVSEHHGEIDHDDYLPDLIPAQSRFMDEDETPTEQTSFTQPTSLRLMKENWELHDITSKEKSDEAPATCTQLHPLSERCSKLPGTPKTIEHAHMLIQRLKAEAIVKARDMATMENQVNALKEVLKDREKKIARNHLQLIAIKRKYNSFKISRKFQEKKDRNSQTKGYYVTVNEMKYIEEQPCKKRKMETSPTPIDELQISSHGCDNSAPASSEPRQMNRDRSPIHSTIQKELMALQKEVRTHSKETNLKAESTDSTDHVIKTNIVPGGPKRHPSKVTGQMGKECMKEMFFGSPFSYRRIDPIGAGKADIPLKDGAWSSDKVTSGRSHQNSYIDGFASQELKTSLQTSTKQQQQQRQQQPRQQQQTKIQYLNRQQQVQQQELQQFSNDIPFVFRQPIVVGPYSCNSDISNGRKLSVFTPDKPSLGIGQAFNSSNLSQQQNLLAESFGRERVQPPLIPPQPVHSQLESSNQHPTLNRHPNECHYLTDRTRNQPKLISRDNSSLIPPTNSTNTSYTTSQLCNSCQNTIQVNPVDLSKVADSQNHPRMSNPDLTATKKTYAQQAKPISPISHIPSKPCHVSNLHPTPKMRNHHMSVVPCCMDQAAVESPHCNRQWACSDYGVCPLGSGFCLANDYPPYSGHEVSTHRPNLIQFSPYAGHSCNISYPNPCYYGKQPRQLDASNGCYTMPVSKACSFSRQNFPHQTHLFKE